MALIEQGNIIPGSGLATPLRSAGTPTGTTFAGVAAPGATLIDTVNLRLYQNQGTQAAPSWITVKTEV